MRATPEQTPEQATKLVMASAVRPRADGLVYSTGAVSRICGVAPRTVSKWFDSGRLGGYRLPGSEDRRIPRADLLAFLKASGMPVPADLEPTEECRVLLVGADDPLAGRLAGLLPADDGWRLLATDSPFVAGLLVRQSRPAAVAVDLSVGRAAATDIARSLRADEAGGPDRALLVALAGEDCGDAGETDLRAAGFDHVLIHPFDPALLAEWLRAGRGD